MKTNYSWTHVDRITITCERGRFNSWKYSGKVWFTKGQTRSYYVINGISCEDVMLRIKAYQKSLKEDGNAN